MLSKASAHWSIYKKLQIELKEFYEFLEEPVLDIGCGTKPFRSFFKENKTNYYGLDIYSKIERQNEPERRKQIDIFGDCINLPVKSSHIGTVFSSFMIEHIFKFNQLFSEAYRVLKNDSHFILISPLMSPIHEIPHDYFRFTKYSLEHIAEQNGFKTIRIKSIGGEILFLGNRFSTYILTFNKSGKANRILERLSFLIQKITLKLDSKIQTENFVCNYLSVFRK